LSSQIRTTYRSYHFFGNLRTSIFRYILDLKIHADFLELKIHEDFLELKIHADFLELKIHVDFLELKILFRLMSVAEFI
jgi:hypothetical protein